MAVLVVRAVAKVDVTVVMAAEVKLGVEVDVVAGLTATTKEDMVNGGDDDERLCRWKAELAAAAAAASLEVAFCLRSPHRASLSLIKSSLLHL